MASLTAEAPSLVWRGRALSGGWYVLPLYSDARVASAVATSPGAIRAAYNASRTSASSASQGLSVGAVVGVEVLSTAGIMIGCPLAHIDVFE